MSGFAAAEDYGWRSLRATAGDAELIVVPEIGGRLMGIRLGGEELLFVNPDLQGLTPNLDKPDVLPTRAPNLRFPLWGGEKTWIAPQSDWRDGVPSPDLDSGPYAVTEKDAGIILTSTVCRRTSLQIERALRVGTNGELTIRHAIHNRGRQSVFVGAWSVMMINRDAVFYLPRDGATTFMSGHPSDIGHVGGLMRVGCLDGARFKTGHHLTEGWFAAFLPRPNGGTAAIVLRSSPLPPGGRWAHGHPAEIFNSDAYPYCEMELHGPALDLHPDGSVSWEMGLHVMQVDGMPQTEDVVRQALRSVAT